MTIKRLILTLSIQILALTVFGQIPNCESVHTGSFKIFTKETGTTFINRTDKLQTERNDDLGYEAIFDLVWINECTYELRPKKLVKGDPSIMGDGTHVLKNKIKAVSKTTYKVQVSSNFHPGVIDFEVEILK